MKDPAVLMVTFNQPFLKKLKNHFSLVRDYHRCLFSHPHILSFLVEKDKLVEIIFCLLE